MKLHNPLIFLYLMTLIVGCGGGGGKYYAPSISLNTLKVIKEKITEEEYKYAIKLEFSHRLELDASDDKIIEGKKHYNFKKIIFNNQLLILAVPADNFISIINSDQHLITQLETPRYVWDVVAIELKHENQEPLLAIFIAQQATSHSSTLYVLDSSFTTIYKEHLLRANWLSKVSSDSGDILLVSAENKWWPDDQWVFIGGDWKYNFFNQ